MKYEGGHWQIEAEWKKNVKHTQIFDPFEWIITVIHIFVRMQSQVIDFYGIHKFIYVLFIAADTSCLDINSWFTISSSGELISPTQNYNLQPKNWGTSANINRIGVHFPIVCIFSGLNCGSILPSNEQKTQIKSTSICIFILLFSFRSFGFLLALWLRSKFSNSIKFYIFPATQRFYFFSSSVFLHWNKSSYYSSKSNDET